MHLCFCSYAAEMLFGKINELYVISEILLLLFVTNLSSCGKAICFDAIMAVWRLFS